MNTHMEISGRSLIGAASAAASRNTFRAVDPATGLELEPPFSPASPAELDRAAAFARQAAGPFGASSGKLRAALLRAIVQGLTDSGEALTGRAHLETGLPIPRLTGELARTTGQLRLFAEVAEEGSWVDARIDEADPARKPLPKPDLRSMLRPLGPVAVFGASNFPLAFSVAGGDTASALAAGCPVIVKAHPAHPGTSEIAGRVIQAAVAACGLPQGVFSLLFDDGFSVGSALVQHPALKAVAFTGSPAGGQALMRLAAARPDPIPCFAEMGSTNPLFILPGALQEPGSLGEPGAALAAALVASFTLGSGQFCTKPGVVFIPEAGSEAFVEALRGAVGSLGRLGMLTPGIAARYGHLVQRRISAGQAEVFAGAQAVTNAEGTAAAMPVVFGVTLEEFRAHPELGEELFGPTTLLVRYGAAGDGIAELVRAAEEMHGHLTATIHGTPEDLAQAAGLVRVLEGKVGRILFNGFPTGVEVAPSMVHGGPFPATSDGRSTSVGSLAILRFARPVCFQDFPDEALPQELRRHNPLGIHRMLNGSLHRAERAL